MSEFVEYNCDTNPYPSFGKKYNSEKAIISLTSWKARINTVSKTLFSLLKQCPGFHIVLVLSEEEFPKMMDELPTNLKLFVDNELIEVLWVFRNYKSFKKVLFTMDKYRDVPVISADDDCIYTCNYAQILYDEWTKKHCAITYKKFICNHTEFQHGPAVLYPPNSFTIADLKLLNDSILNTNQDDIFIGLLLKAKNISISNITNKVPYIFHDCVSALSNTHINIHNSISFIKNELMKSFKI